MVADPPPPQSSEFPPDSAHAFLVAESHETAAAPPNTSSRVRREGPVHGGSESRRFLSLSHRSCEVLHAQRLLCALGTVLDSSSQLQLPLNENVSK